MLLALVLAALPESASAASRLVFGRQVGSLGSQRGINNGSFINLNQIQDLPGAFSNIKNVNNNLVEFTSDAFGNPRVSNLFIDGFGRLVGATLPNTIKQAKEFYLTNFNKFAGAASQAIQRFLIANGGASALRGFTIDLASSVTPKEGVEPDIKTVEYAQGKEEQVKLAALNYLINMISQSADIFTVNPALVRGGQVGVNLLRFLKPEAIALLTNENPYACTGNEPFRVDLLISRAMDPDIYARLTGAPDKFDQLAKQFGISEQRRDYPGRHIVAAGPPGKEESIVGRHPQRILGFREQLNVGGEDAYVSYDNRYNLPNGAQAESADAFRNGIDTSFEAGEMIFRKPNGFPFYYLAANPGGARARSAPVEFAQSSRFSASLSRREGHSTDVSSPINCMVCHTNGLLGGGISLKTKNRYTENTPKLPLNSQRFFTSNDLYQQRVKRSNTIFRNSLVAAGAFVPDPKSPMQDAFPGESVPAMLIPDMYGEYNADLSVEAAAKELKVSASSLAGLLQTNPQGKVSRKQFESQFCNIKNRLGGGSALVNNFQNQIGGAGSLGAGGLGGLRPVSHITGL